MRYTLTPQSAAAHSMHHDLEVLVPDEVAANQKDYDGKTFPILKPASPYSRCGPPYKRGRGMLMGDEYGLHTTGTGDMIIKVVG